ncbi:hypothetical protein PGJ_00017190 [Porphyromonas gingivalis AJW4]|nr:hypothetical protein PGJ_00017190 [Porphyromonas gingivalis AJW4]
MFWIAFFFMSEKKPWSMGQIAGCDFLQTLIIPRQFDVRKRQFDLSEHTIKITSSCKSYSFVILRLHNDREEGAASKSLGFRCR